MTTLDELRGLTTRRSETVAQWNTAIRDLRKSGVHAKLVADAAKITLGRVWQIEHHRR